MLELYCWPNTLERPLTKYETIFLYEQWGRSNPRRFAVECYFPTDSGKPIISKLMAERTAHNLSYRLARETGCRAVVRCYIPLKKEV